MSGPFKMKGSPMQRNFGAGSSPFQAATDTDKGGYKYGKEEKTSDVTTKTKGGTSNRKTFETKGTKYTPPTKTPAGDDAYEKLSPGDRKKQDDKYIASNTKTNTKKRTENSSTRRKIDKVPPLPPKTVELSPKNKVTPKKPKTGVVTTKVSSLFGTGEKTVVGGKNDGKKIKTKSKFAKVVSKIKLPKKRVKRRKLCKKKRGSTQCSF